MTPRAADLVPRIVAGDEDIIVNSLSFVRSHLDMEAAYLSEFIGDDMVLRAVCAPGLDSDPSCGRVHLRDVLLLKSGTARFA